MSFALDCTIYDQGFARVATATTEVALASPAANANRIIEVAKECHEQACAAVVFPELTLSGYSADELFLQDALIAAVVEGIDQVVKASEDLFPILVVGAPLRFEGRLFNCAVFIHAGKIIGISPKQYLPNYREFYEKRYFTTLPKGRSHLVSWGKNGITSGNDFPFGSVIVESEDLPNFCLGLEICEDLWIPSPPSSLLSLAGATVIANLSASPVTVGRADSRELLVKSQSLRTLSAYLYTAAGFGESTNDLAWDGQQLICELGETLATSARFQAHNCVTYADIDLDAIAHERSLQNSFSDNRSAWSDAIERENIKHVQVRFDPALKSSAAAKKLLREVPKFPFVSGDEQLGDRDFYESFNIQVSALKTRMASTQNPKLVIGVSGGLDSTHALLVCAAAVDELGLDRSNILAYSMPGFATSASTRSNAQKLALALQTSFQELDIRPTAEAMLKTIGHPAAEGEEIYDVTYENIQAGLRTDYLFRLANQNGGIVIGTGDLSELALGWCTYGVGDQMSHYAVNTGLPKTMIQHLIRWVSKRGGFAAEKETLQPILEEILAQEISPELVPGKTLQSTESRIGPYELQDFTLYHLLRHGSTPKKIFFLAKQTWGEKYTDEELVKWLRVFHGRFFASQFKRTAIPNGPKMMRGGSLSPRGDWRMPSDSLSDLWLRQIDELGI